MMTPKQIHDEDTLLFNNDTEIVRELKRDQGFVFRMNINNRLSSNLHSILENIYNTIKDRPDIDLIQHDNHMYGSYPPVENETFSFKEEVLSALTIIRKFEDEMHEKSIAEYKKRDPNFANHLKVAKECIRLNLEHERKESEEL